VATGIGNSSISLLHKYSCALTVVHYGLLRDILFVSVTGK